MATIQEFNRSQLKKDNPLLSSFKAIIESAFYSNNVTNVPTLQEAYQLAYEEKKTIVTDLLVKEPENLDLPIGTKVLVTQDGAVVGRTAKARRIIGQPGVDASYYQKILQEAVYKGSLKNFYKGTALVGLSEEFGVKAHLLLPEGFEVNFYSWLLNFQIWTEKTESSYKKTPKIPENDIYIYADPDWQHPDFPDGLAFFDPFHNVAAILGLRYFGELKKATLTLTWATAHRQGFVACHGGMKQYQLPGKNFTMAAFGLSGSGKSTITLADAKDESIPVKILHDDAFIINEKTGATTALEPAYFDKMQDYPMDSPVMDYLLTVQNVGVTLDENGKRVLVTEDIRNGNGRTVKSRLLTKNRVNFLPEKTDAIFWIMKDDAFPPLVKITNASLATLFGVTLATKRSTAENVQENLDQLVMEPFANPFRCYPLVEDFTSFKALFESGVSCYILNTGFFNGKKITPTDTLDAIHEVILDSGDFADFEAIRDFSYLKLANHPVDFSDIDYLNKVKKRLIDRLSFLNEKKVVDEGYNALPQSLNEELKQLILALGEKIAAEMLH